MKKILIVDPLTSTGHVNYNFGIIKAAMKNYDVDVISRSITSVKLQEKGIPSNKFVWTFPDEWHINVLAKKWNKIIYHLIFRYYIIKILLRVFRMKNKYDRVIITCIDIYSFWFLSWLYNKKVLVIDHGIGNVKDNTIYRCLWRLTNPSVKLIVLEEYIKDMVEASLYRNVYLLKHPLPQVCPSAIVEENSVVKGNLSIFNNKENVSIVYAPSSGNDLGFMEELCHTKIPKLIRVIAKSSFAYESAQLKIYNLYITDDEYNYYLDNSDFILLPYPSSYNYRISAVLFEALVRGKRVLVWENNTLKYYSMIFPEQVFSFTDIADLFEKVEQLKWHVIRKPNLYAYSDEKLVIDIKKVLE